MGARELLCELTAAGVGVVADGGRLIVAPASKLTDAMCDAIRAAKPELLAILAPANTRPYRLSKTDADRCHFGDWDDAEIAAFTTRVLLFVRRGIDATDADDLAEHLTLRDRDGDELRLCLECQHYRPGRCGNHRAAGLNSPELGRDLAAMLQRCRGFRTDSTGP
jgi:hypothetical protein